MHAINFEASGAEYFQQANDNILVVLQTESPTGIKNAPEIYALPGCDAIFIGPVDLRAQMRGPDGKDPTPQQHEAAVQKVEGYLGDALAPFRTAVDRLKTMPGLSETAARVLVAEIGTDMSRFPTPGHLVSWAGLCPRLATSAGKRQSTRIRHATPWLKTTLIQCAWAAARTKGSYLQAQFLRLKGRRGPKKAIVAVAASMLTAAYVMLRDDVDYADLGGRYFQTRDIEQAKKRLLRRLRDLGVEVEIKAA